MNNKQFLLSIAPVVIALLVLYIIALGPIGALIFLSSVTGIVALGYLLVKFVKNHFND